MTISFKSMEHSSVERLEQIMSIEKQAFGKGALSEYVIVPMLRYGKVYAAVDENNIVDLDESGLAPQPPAQNTVLAQQALQFLADDLHRRGVLGM